MGVAFLVTMCEKPLIHLLSQQHNLILKSFRKEKLLSFVWRESINRITNCTAPDTPAVDAFYNILMPALHTEGDI